MSPPPSPIPVLAAVPARFLAEPALSAIVRLATSHRRLTGHPLVEANEDTSDAPALVAALWQAPQVILAHGVEEDPLFFFANALALAAFETDLDHLIGSPSRLSAEAPLRAERQALLDRVSARGFIDDYAGVRISARGRRFPIAAATVWSLLDADGTRHGQAACFAPPDHARAANAAASPPETTP